MCSLHFLGGLWLQASGLRNNETPGLSFPPRRWYGTREDVFPLMGAAGAPENSRHRGAELYLCFLEHLAPKDEKQTGKFSFSPTRG